MSAAITKKSVPLLKGDDGVVQTLLLMERLALRDAKNPDIKAKAKSLKGRNDVQTIQNIYTWVVDNYKYKKDPDKEEHVTAPKHLLNNCDRFFGCQHVDCDDYTTFLTSLLIAAGFKVAFRVLSWRADSFTHVYLVVYLPEYDGWTPVDAVMGRSGLWNEKGREAHRRTLTFPVGKVMEMLEEEVATQLALEDAFAAYGEGAQAVLADILAEEAEKKKGSDYQLKTDFGQVAGRLFNSLGFPPNFENLKTALKKEVVNICETETDGYISSKIWLIGGAVVGALGLGAGIGYYFGQRNK